MKRSQQLKLEAGSSRMKSFKFAEFGTRRPLSLYTVHNRVVAILPKALPDNFIGTSNYHLAPGAQSQQPSAPAHEYLQAASGACKSAQSQERSSGKWLESVYRGRLGVP